MKFIELFLRQNNLSAVEQQNLHGKLFQQNFELIAENRLSLWDFEKVCLQNKTGFLLGVTPSWNYYDLYLLDCINDSLKKKSINEVLKIFDLDQIGNLENLQKIFGNINPKQPPILGLCNKGVLSKSLWGWDAINFLIEKFDFVWQPPKLWLNKQ
jgi:hypothetical protein